MSSSPGSEHAVFLSESRAAWDISFYSSWFGRENVTPGVSGKWFTSGEMEMSRQMGQAPNWIPGQFTQRTIKSSTLFSPIWCRFSSWQTLTAGILFTSKPFLMPLPLPGPSPSLSLEAAFISFSLNVISLKAFPEPKFGSGDPALCFWNIFYITLSKYSSSYFIITVLFVYVLLLSNLDIHESWVNIYLISCFSFLAPRMVLGKFFGEGTDA